LAVLLLASNAIAHGSDDQHMFRNWAQAKAMESCWGEENMKIYTVNMKKAVAKCHQVDAPELELPPFRSIDRLVNTLVSHANNMESHQYEKLYRMMTFINNNHYNNRHRNNYDSMTYMKNFNNFEDDSVFPFFMKKSYDQSPSMNKFKTMMLMNKMMNSMKNDDYMMEKMTPYDMKDSMDMQKFEKMFEMMSELKFKNKPFDYMNTKDDAVLPIQRSVMPSYRGTTDFEKMANIMLNFRSKREANDALALNDRLKEKIQAVFEEQQARIGNMTCVLKEMNVLNDENEIDVRAMKKDAEQYNLPSAWFKERYEQIVDTCYEVATNLPSQLDEVVEGDFGTVKLGQMKSFMSCCKNSKQRLCMNQDVKNKIETNFGPVEEILESFKYQITENQLFTHVNQLLQGSEEEYM